MHNPPVSDLERGNELAKALARRIRKAELVDGHIQGAAILHKEDGTFQCQCFIDVTFYPHKQWWLIEDGAKTKEPLTPELYERVKRLSL